ncbi:hypothetical protein MINS_25830 [Mycolicibacterium insubricum]|nr:hypothetical protein MINS_25830 [Mycolicibacterium insubricum]
MPNVNAANTAAAPTPATETLRTVASFRLTDETALAICREPNLANFIAGPFSWLTRADDNRPGTTIPGSPDS